LIEFTERKETSSVFEFFVLDELTDELPARIIFFDVFFWGLLGAWQQGSGFQIHQVGRHDDELGSEVDVQELERVDVIQVLFGDFLDRDRLDIQLVLFDEVEQEIQRTFEDFELNFVIGVFQGRKGLGIYGNLIWQDRWWLGLMWGEHERKYGFRAMAKL
jgi:hypothetical protein